jgi:tryptophan halogenase
VSRADQPIRKVTIVGGGTAGWSTAAVLSQLVPEVEVTLVESEEIGIVGVGEATIPQIRHLVSQAGIDPLQMISETKATFKLGIDFVGWGAPGERYIHGFGKIGRRLRWLHPHQLWLSARARTPDKVQEFDRYTMSCVAALKNRFSFPDPRHPNSPLADLDYAYNFDASLFAQLLRRESEPRGVKRVEGRIVEVIKNAESGYVEQVRLEDGREVAGELFIDCSGMRALLIGDALGNDYEDWNHWLLCDRAQAVPSESVEPVTPYVRCTAGRAGWQWRIPLQHRVGNGYVYASNLLEDDEAGRIVLGNLDSSPIAEPRVVRFRPGRRAKCWDKNVVAIGLSSGFLEPLESTSIHLIHSGIQRLLSLFPGQCFSQVDIDEYNRQTRAEYEDVRDFIIAHYKVTRRGGDPFWDYVREMEIPDSLAARLELFRSSGRFFEQDVQELFSEESWVQVLIGQGFDMGVDPATAFLPPEEIALFLEEIAAVIDNVAETMPDHGEFVRRLPRSNAPAARPGAITSGISFRRASA